MHVFESVDFRDVVDFIKETHFVKTTLMFVITVCYSLFILAK